MKVRSNPRMGSTLNALNQAIADVEGAIFGLGLLVPGDVSLEDGSDFFLSYRKYKNEWVLCIAGPAGACVDLLSANFETRLRAAKLLPFLVSKLKESNAALADDVRETTTKLYAFCEELLAESAGEPRDGRTHDS